MPDKSEQELKELRAQMDAVNEEMAGLFRQRQELARRIGALKRQAGLPITDSGREEEILRRWAAGDPQTEALFRELFRLAKEAE